MSDFYQKIEGYLFKVEEIELSTKGVEDLGRGAFINVEETRKNGQEDTHMGGCLEKIKGKWEWEDKEFNMFDEYCGESLADGIVKYLNEHEPPKCPE